MQWLGTVLSPSVDLILLCCQHEREKIICTDFLKGMWVLTIKMSLGKLRKKRAGLNFYSGNKPLCRILFSEVEHQSSEAQEF